MQKKKNIASPSTTQHHDTPNNKTHFIKFRVTEIEKWNSNIPQNS